MNTELSEYFEREFQEFEGNWFAGRSFWRVPVSNLKDTPLFGIFEEFIALFPDHPTEFGTVFYLIQSTTNDFSILFRCPHFEHATSEDLPNLAKFIDVAATQLTSVNHGEVELLDANSETLHLRFYSVRDDIAALLKSRSSLRS